MSRTIELGTTRVTGLIDGTVRLPPSYFPGLDLDRNREVFRSDGTYHFPIGCFLIETQDGPVLVDAGLGPAAYAFPEEVARANSLEQPPEYIAEGGSLADALAGTGVAPEDISAVVLTHLHADHIGWVAPSDDLYFPNAHVYCGRVDWEISPTDPAPGEAEGRTGLSLAEAGGRLVLMDEAMVGIASGVTARQAPGHTPGHYVVEVSTRSQKVLLLGDVLHHPLQLNDEQIYFCTEPEPTRAIEMRKRLFDEAAETGAILGMSHFPEVSFQRIETRARGRAWTAVT